MNSNDVKSVYASGTAYDLTGTAAAIDFGTTDPSLTLPLSGNYLIFSRATVAFSGATFAGNETMTLKLRRTNNTASDVTGASSTQTLPIITTQTNSFGTVVLPPVLYSTQNGNDAIAMYGALSDLPGAGDVQVTEAEIIAIRLF